MADVANTIQILNLLPLEELRDDWVKNIWESDFTDILPLDEEIDNGPVHEALKNLQAELDGWISWKEDDGDALWTVLVENNIYLKTLIAFLALLLTEGQKRLARAEQKELGILAGTTYLRLVTVPGSGAFKVFHPELYEKSVDILKIFTHMGSSKRKRSLSPVTNSQRSHQSKSKRRNRNPEPSFDEETEEGLNNSGGEEEIEDLTPQEVNKMRTQLMYLIRSLIVLLQNFSLRQSESSAYHTVQVLTQLITQDADLCDIDAGPSVSLERMSLPSLAFRGLSLLCTQLHGHVGSMLNAVCKYLLPCLLMMVENKSFQTIPRQMITARDHAIKFVCCLLREGGDKACASVRTLLQHMCTKVPDKAEYRIKVAQAVVTILQDLPADSYGRMVEWFYKLSKHSKLAYRGFSLEIVSALLAEPERQMQGTEGIPPEIQMYTRHKSLVGILLARCSDMAPTVRARAIACFSQCFLSDDAGIKGTIKEIVTPHIGSKPANAPRLIPTPGNENRHLVRVISKEIQSVYNQTEQTIQQQSTTESAVTAISDKNTGVVKKGQTPLQGIELTPGFDPNLEDSEGVLSMLRRRCGDEKVNVRKSSLQAIERIIRFEAPNYRKKDLEILRDRCRDPALSVRKQAMMSLTELLQGCPFENNLQSAWLDGILPLIIDRETTLQEKCLEILEEVILGNIVPSNRSTKDCHELAWGILGVLAKDESVDQRRYIQKACHHWSRQGKIKSGLITALESHINTINNEGAWVLLAEIAPAAPKINHGFLMKYWDEHAHQANSSKIMERVLTVMKYVCKHIPHPEREKLIDDLKRCLMKFDSPPELISITVSTLSKLCAADDEEAGIQSVKDDWCLDLLSACDLYLSKTVLEEEGSIENEDLVVRHLFTLGEIAQLYPAKITKHIFLLVQSMIASPCITPLSSQSLQNSQETVKSSQASIASSPETNAIESSQSSQQTNESSQGSQQSLQLSQPTQALSQFRGSKMSNRVRAFAFITLGKLCLQHEDLAKKCVAALARELETSPDPAIRNNVVMVLCDLCVRYTTTADRYVTNIASCLKDPSPLVRKQTLTLITRLLQEDFLKWKGVLFYRFITTLLDDCKEIAEFAEFCLVHLLIQRHPNMFFQHFMECIFHFNSYEDHAVFNKFPQTEREKAMFSLKGDQNAEKRQKLYLLMLDHMPDEQKFQLTAKLVQEVLGGVVDGLLPLNDSTCHILKDTLVILSSKEIKLSTLKARHNEEMASDEQEMAAVVVAAAKKTLITQVVKKNVIENIVPIVISLKHLLERNCSSVTHNLMFYLRELMKDYRNEVEEILSADRQTAKEIEFDLRKFEEQEEEKARAALQTPLHLQKDAMLMRSNSNTPAVARKTPTTSPAPRVPELSPRTPGSVHNSPRMNRVMSPNPVTNAATPLQKPASPSVGTPSRQGPLSTLAILNSAKKAMEEARLVHNSLVPQCKRTRSKSGQADVLMLTDENVPANGSEFSQLDILGTPERQKTYRAISTPAGTLDDITFHGDQNITMLPPSPILKTQIRNRGNRGLVLTPKKVLNSKEDKTREVILMKSPEAVPPKPKQWNIKSPIIAARGEERPLEEYEGELEPELPKGDNEPANSSQTSNKPRRSTRSLGQTNNNMPDRVKATPSGGRSRKKKS
ncbi:hypothetical protein CHS0354_011171 [Potamilus streckersoni]|uniref:Condensin complex subunit 1 C-terminal domain-containing protein n=1 Tax=Potamilus streckersoni TaxID=2493646 RepID=A0AAE0S0S4_9BIVA|nr:hypothetical protein CHS0354_011171 [Potamilus streckersoni]